jgi:hypothetical protein
MNINNYTYEYIMEGIYQATSSFDFNQLKLISPTTMAGGNYFIKFRLNQYPLYIQPPQCILKNGIQKSGKKLFSDLIFTHENEEFIQWMENLEIYCRKQIFENRAKWFETDLDETDIENFFTSPIKIYKSGKNYCVRTNIPTLLGNCSLKIYNENEEEIGIEKLKENDNVVSVLEFQGIKCSPRNFHIEIEIKQMMVLDSKPLFEKCVFTQTKKHQNMETVNKGGIEDTENNTEKETSTFVSMSEHTESAPIHLYQNHVESQSHEEALFNSTPNNLDKHVSSQHSVDNNAENEIININEKVESEENPDSLYLEELPKSRQTELEEIEFNLDELPKESSIQLKQRNNVYYDMYKEAKRKAKLARDLAISSYLEAQNIKQTYMLDDIEDSDSDLDDTEFENMNLF